jgi:2-polyprenyl-3-methyl-5-hydroxy-6-metoxy-1,4-benzoquinol methylase
MEPTVNLSHARQDITRQREFDPTRTRYRFAEALLPVPEPGTLLADIGGGAGEFCAVARHHGYLTHLIDGNQNSVLAERQRGFSAQSADLTRGLEDVADAAFDVVVSLEVIEHIVTAELLLSEMARVLKPGGTLVLSTPNFGFAKDRLKYLLGGEAKEEGYHFRFYTQSRLEGMVAAAGLMIEQRRSLGSALGINWLLRMLSFGRFRIAQFPCPRWCESWLAMTFAWRLRKPLLVGPSSIEGALENELVPSALGT